VRSSRPHLAAVSIVVILATAMAVATATSSAAESPPPFCEETKLHDYLKPLGRMKHLRPPPADGVLDFGPRWLRFSMPPTLLITAPGNLRVSFGESGSGPPPSHASRRLDWKILSTVARVDAAGRAAQTLLSKRTRIRFLGYHDHPEQLVTVPRASGLYRLSVSFRDAENRRLGSFGSYFRVAPLTEHAKLGLSATSYRPGEAVFGRVENFGTATALLGVGYNIERFDGSAWSRAPEAPHIFPAIGYWALPGMTSPRCSAFGIPSTMPPGHYRMTKMIDFARSHPGAREAEAELQAEFDIVP
jgi:hypothetical protein